MKISILEFGICIYIYIYIFFSFAFIMFPAWQCFFNLRQSCSIIKFLFKLVHLFLVLSACYLCVIYWIIINILILNVVTIERWGSLLLLFFYYFFPFLHHWPAIATLHSWIVCGSVVPNEIGSKETSQPTANKSTPPSQIGAPGLNIGANFLTCQKFIIICFYMLNNLSFVGHISVPINQTA